MSLIPQEKLNKKIEEIVENIRNNTYTHQINKQEAEIAMNDLITWYNEQIVEELEGMVDLDDRGGEYLIGYNSAISDIISKLQDTLPDNNN